MIVSVKSQLRIILLGLLMNSMGLIALYLIGRNILFDLVEDYSHNEAHKEFAATLGIYFNISFFIIYVLTSLGVFIVLVLQSNQIVGPVLKISNALKQLNQNQLKKSDQVNLRKGDFFGDLADEVNRLINKYGN